jgi:hypothetical protein
MAALNEMYPDATEAGLRHWARTGRAELPQGYNIGPPDPPQRAPKASRQRNTERQHQRKQPPPPMRLMMDPPALPNNEAMVSGALAIRTFAASLDPASVHKEKGFMKTAAELVIGASAVSVLCTLGESNSIL